MKAVQGLRPFVLDFARTIFLNWKTVGITRPHILEETHGPPRGSLVFRFKQSHYRPDTLHTCDGPILEAVTL
jgi:hypothetical protein